MAFNEEEYHFSREGWTGRLSRKSEESEVGSDVLDKVFLKGFYSNTLVGALRKG